MNRILALALVAGVAACSKKTPTTTPTPTTGGSTATPAPAPAPLPPPPSSSGGGSDATAAAERARLLAVLQAPIHFDYDKDDIRPGADQQALDAKAAILLANPGVQVTVAGHTDDRGSDEYNLVLGGKRAAAAKRYLESKGIDGGRIKTISYGEERPADTSGTEEGWAKNRRDEFEIGGADRLVAPK
jgi:peptidoglycan-associated lipoprotein